MRLFGPHDMDPAGWCLGDGTNSLCFSLVKKSREIDGAGRFIRRALQKDFAGDDNSKTALGII